MKKQYKIVGITLVVGLIFGYIIAPSGDKKGVPEAMHNHNMEMKSTKKVYTCSMHPQIKSDKPGDCPICGMELIPMTSMSESDMDMMNENEPIQMSKSAMALANIEVASVKKEKAYKNIRLLGTIMPNENAKSVSTSRFSGRIETLSVSYVGQKVTQGQQMATIYSPQLIAAQKELLIAAQSKESNEMLYQSAVDKLLLWGITQRQVDEIEKSRNPMETVAIFTPVSGFVSQLKVAKGDYVKEGSTLFVVDDLSTVWAMFDVYEPDLGIVSVGDRIQFTTSAYPSKKFDGRAIYEDPFVNPKTRVAQLRLEVNNSQFLLKPNMFVTGNIKAEVEHGKKVLIIPQSAVLWTGKRSVVYVKDTSQTQPSFSYREVVLGNQLGDNMVVVDKGLQEGEKIVVNGAFKIDAAAQLEGKKSMMND